MIKRSDQGMHFLDEKDALKNPPEVFITLAATKRIECFVRRAPGEINGLGVVEEQDNGLVITNVFTLPEKVDFGSADYTDAFNDFLTDFVADGGDPSQLKFQWHSHGNIPAFYSEEDKETIETCLGDYRISLVISKKRQYRCRLDVFKPFYLGLEIPLLVVLPPIRIEKEVMGKCAEEMAQNVKGISFLERGLDKLADKISGLGPVNDEDEAGGSSGRIVMPYECLVFEEAGDELPETA